MPTPTYTPLANVTLSLAASTFQFSNISPQYQDLIVVGVVRAGAQQTITGRFNGDTGSNYNYQYMAGNGSSTAAASAVNANRMYWSFLAQSLPGSDLFFTSSIFDYSATNKNKTVLSRGNNAIQMVDAVVNRWTGTAAINSVSFFPNTGNFPAGSTFALYGVIA
jgi:hypothetical protein